MVIHNLRGSLIKKKEGFIVVEVNGIGYKIFVPAKIWQNLPEIGSEMALHTHLHVREDAMDLFGFLSEAELNFFEKLISISGIGPRSALGVMGVAPVDQLIAAINEGKTDLLTRASGIGKKTADRVILELKDKLPMLASKETVIAMESDLDLEEALVGLGYSKAQAKKAVSQISSKTKKLEDRLKEALKIIK